MKKLLFLLLTINCSLLTAQAQWVQMSLGTGNVRVFSLAANENYMFAGTVDNGVYKSTNNGVSWSQIFTIYTLSVASNGNNIFAGTGGFNGIYLSTDNGANWIQTLSNRIVWSVAVNGNYAYAGTYAYGVYRSTDNGTSWTPTSLSNQNTWPVVTIGNNVFASSSNGVYKSTDNGITWTQTFTIYASAIAANGNSIFAGTASGVYLSTDNGNTWTQTSLNNQNIHALAASGNNVFAGTSNAGVYVSNDNGANWTQRNEGLGNFSVLSLCIFNNYVFDGTDGTGIYRRQLDELIGIKPISEQMPGQFKLYQNYPNPFNPATTIKFDLPTSPLIERGGGGFVSLEVYDILGKEMATLVNEKLQPGTYEIQFDASQYSSGIYYYELRTGNFTDTKKMLMIK